MHISPSTIIFHLEVMIHSEEKKDILSTGHDGGKPPPPLTT